MTSSSVPLLLPSALQWNTNGLRDGLFELRREVALAHFDVLGFQETHVFSSEGKISSYTSYHNKTFHSSGLPRLSLLVHVDVDMCSIDLSDLCST